MPSKSTTLNRRFYLQSKAAMIVALQAFCGFCLLVVSAHGQDAPQSMLPAQLQPQFPGNDSLMLPKLRPLVAGQTRIKGDILVGLNPAMDTNEFAKKLQRIGQASGRSKALSTVRIHLNAGVSDADALNWLRQQHEVRYAENNHRIQVTATPNDASYSAQWALPKIKADQAASNWKPQGQVVLAIVDTGVDYSHLDLNNVMFKDTAGNVIGYDATGGNSFYDGYGHGTHCAGIAAAQINNGGTYQLATNNGSTGAFGIAGAVGWNGDATKSDTSHIKIMPVRVLDNSGSGSDAWVADGITWAADHGAQVISMSLGEPDDPNAPGPPATLNAAVQYAWSKGVVVVAAAGNDGSTANFYPAACANVVSVAATDGNDALAGFSNFGSWVNVAAPGVNIYSTLPTYQTGANANTHYGLSSGTSMATPHIAAEAALLRAQKFTLTNQQVRDAIINNVDVIIGGRSIANGNGGRANFLAALNAVTPISTNITGLYSTGVDSNGNAAGQGGTDAHWTLASTPGGGSGTAYVAVQNWTQYQNSWLADSATSQWLAPTTDVLAKYSASGSYTWQTTFTVTGDPTAVKITGRFTGDDQVAAIILNGNTLYTNSVAGYDYNKWTSLTLSSGFVSGVNTLQFIVVNNGNYTSPTGFRAELTGSGTNTGTGGAAAIPAAPTNLAAVPGNRQVTLNWTTSADATSYNVKRGTNINGPFTPIATLVGTNSFTDGGTKYNGDSQLANGGTYYYIVTAMNSGGESAPSNVANATLVSTVSSITGLYSTGVDSNGNAAGQGGTDAHWTLASTPGGGSGTAYVAVQNWTQYQNSWLADSATSQWLAPTTDVLAKYSASGSYTWQTTFTVTGDPTAVKITGRFTGDDQVAAIILNGNTLYTNSVAGYDYNKWTSLTLSSGFVSGVNTLQFIVVNNGNYTSPTGFRAELSGLKK